MKILRELIQVFRRGEGEEEIPRASGIYQIRCIPTGKIYVGSAVNLQKRWTQHRSALRHNRHGNKMLQNAWNKYGEYNFDFTLLEFVDKSNLIHKEQEWMDRTDCANRQVGFNIFDAAGSPGDAFVQVWEDFIDPDGNDVTIRNLHEFCREHNLDNSSMIRLAQGKSKLKSYKGWSHKNSVRKRDYIKTWDGFIDPDGNPVGTITNLAAFCRERGLDDTHMIALAKGKLHIHKGWTHSNKREHLGHKTYRGFIDPQGERVLITNLREFCRKNNLHPAHMHQLLNGQRKSHKGWTWRSENENE